MKKLILNQNTIICIVCSIVLGVACGIVIFKLYFREVTFISVTCENPKISYTEPLDMDGDFKCNWKSVDFENHYMFYYYQFGGK